MSLHLHALARWRIRRLYAGGLPPRTLRALLAEVRGCPSCAGFYEQQDRLESALCLASSASAGPANSHLVLARLEPLVLEQGLDKTEPSSGWHGFRAWAWAPALAMAAVLLWISVPDTKSQLVALDPAARLAQVGMVARGAPSSPATDVGVRLLRVVPEEAVVQEAGPLSLQDVVTLVYTNFAPGMRYLAILGVQEGGRIRWYYPDYSEKTSIPVLTGVVDQPLRDGIRLSVFHSPGWLRVTALFSDRPLEKKGIEDAVRGLAARPEALHQLEPLRIDGAEVLETTFLVTIEGQGRQ
ncbi:MAG: hypothetical protein HY901_38095 [Deltaproteobacteria bacterium]|nr:hypothetical protein [Deltaproteobacteria bacterium]